MKIKTDLSKANCKESRPDTKKASVEVNAK
jgi:hypothetical protein